MPGTWSSSDAHLLVVLVSILLPTAVAGAGGVPLLPAGPVMSVERAAHTATLLADGRVLITGGMRAGDRAITPTFRSFLYRP